MDVAIHEAGQHEVALSVDDSGGSAAIFFALVLGPNGKNFLSADGERLRRRLLRIRGVDYGAQSACIVGRCRRARSLSAGAKTKSAGYCPQASGRGTDRIRLA